MDNLYSKEARNKARLAELIAKANAHLAEVAAKEQAKADAVKESVKEIDVIPTIQINTKLQKALDLVYNKEQDEFLNRVIGGESINLIGKAGTGKTTIVRATIQAMRESGKIGVMQSNTKYLRSGLPGVVVVSFTNRAVKNLAKGMPADLKQHCLTVHKLLEFRPVKVTVKNAKGEDVESMRFLPNRDHLNPLPPELKAIFFEESSMISTELYNQLMDAIPHECQFIYLGDLQQLPPVYGKAILGYKLNEQPTVELTEIYRQAAGSPIIQLAHRISNGEVITKDEFPELSKKAENKVIIKPWKKSLNEFDALHMLTLFVKDAIKRKHYDPNEDMIMMPFNKGCGTIELNKEIAQFLGRERDAMVYEIIAGFNKFFFAIGDKILVDRQEAMIEAINHNADYKGSQPQLPHNRLNRWGIIEKEQKETHDTEISAEQMDELEDFMLRQLAKDPDDEEAKHQASHILVCRLLDSDEIVEVRTTGEYSSIVFAYALTVHKCQGSEWRKCFLFLHRSHATMLNRELLYTAVTRAREELVIICEPDSFVKGVKTQRIKGTTITEKAEFFKGEY